MAGHQAPPQRVDLQLDSQAMASQKLENAAWKKVSHRYHKLDFLPPDPNAYLVSVLGLSPKTQ